MNAAEAPQTAQDTAEYARQVSRAQAIKEECLSTGTRPFPTEFIRKLMEECGDLFYETPDAWAFLAEEDRKEDEGRIKVRLILDVEYILNGENVTEMAGRLRKMCEYAIGNGMLTGETDAEVEQYSMDVAIQPEPLEEDEIADFMLQRIENGDLDLEDISVRLARFGLMEPNDFVDEMRERMELTKKD